MRIILDQDIHFVPVPAELGLDADTASDLLYPGMKLGSEDCVILFSSMANGFMAVHQRLLMENPDVSRWIVVLVKQNYVFTSSKISGVLNELHAQGDVIPCFPYHAGKLRIRLEKCLKQAVVDKKSCLICSRSADMDLLPMAELLEDMLPGWKIEVRAGSNPPLDSGHGHLIAAGRELQDFIGLPAEIAPRTMLTLVQTPGNAQISRRRDDLNRFILNHSGMNWSMEIVRRRTFIINPTYENMRRLILKKPAAANQLRNDPAFIMWDQFKLPVRRSLYTDEAIGAFLENYNECEKLVDRLKSEGGEKYAGKPFHRSEPC